MSRSKAKGFYSHPACDVRAGCWTTEEMLEHEELHQELQEDLIMQEADDRINSKRKTTNG